ncbi:MAG: phosphate ABC transporter substrate-binding protein PstS [Burkholderiaceae bacterium]|jgi:phosphate transport system substrate-binding protein|nr:phosphate ABC transporter substrate-binding protein PstS [Burkholderiaceae bacterium]
MKNMFTKVLVGGAVMAFSLHAAAQTITGAGATFPYPVYAKWAEAYKKETGVSLNYQSIGSSGGMRQIRAKTVTFGASDAPVKGADLSKDGMVQFPAVIGGTIPVFNLEGFKPGDLRITGDVLAEMFVGYIVNWNDPKIAALNPGKKLPDQTITVVHRADGSGTTFNFTDYLTVVSKLWAEKVGRGAAVKWPAASSIGGKGNEGVAANVARVKGAVGYVEYAYAKKNNIPYMSLQNKDGKFIRPDDKTFAAAAAGADWFSVPGMGLSIVNQPGADSWPISTASFILMYKQPSDKKASADVLKFFDWSFKNGKQLALDLDYVPLPDILTAQIRSKVWSEIQNK